jgi:glycosyl transferase family 2
MTAPPLVTIGIPTYNRSRQLERAVRSALAQNHPSIEVVVSDNASPDDSEDTLRRLADGDDRLRWERQARNLGHAKNFARVFEMARGELFMWLSDDDWLDPGYVCACARRLAADPSLSLAWGRARYFRDGEFVTQERTIDLLSESPARRVLSYYWLVDINGPMYGVMRRAQLARVPFRELLGGDWLLVGAMAAMGRVITVQEAHINRSVSGLSSDASGLATGEFALGGLRARNPHVWIAWTLLQQIGHRDPGFRAVGGPVRRTAVGVLAALSVLLRFTALDLVRRGLHRTGLLPYVRRLIAPLRARRHA